jgi:hypothetical protein
MKESTKTLSTDQQVSLTQQQNMNTRKLISYEEFDYNHINNN